MNKKQLLEKILPPLLQYELECIKEDGTFEINLETFNPMSGSYCVYGQRFGGSIGRQVKEFQNKYDIINPFHMDYGVSTVGIATALEYWTYYYWSKGEKDKVIDLLRRYIKIQGEDVVVEEDLFKIELS